MGPIPQRQVCPPWAEHSVRLSGSSYLEVAPLVALSFVFRRSCLGNLSGLCREGGSCCMDRLLVYRKATCSFRSHRLVRLVADHRDRKVADSSKGHDRMVALGSILVHEGP